MREYFLPSHVSFCIDGDAVVFLDLKLDKYRMLRGTDASEFLSLLPAAPTSTANSLANPPDEDGEQTTTPKAINAFVEAGLLTVNTQGSKPLRPTHLEPAAHQLIGDHSPATPSIHLINICTFLASCASAAIRLRLQNIDNIVESVTRRKALRQATRPIDLDKTRRLVATFNRLRGFFPANYLCLFDSLALIEFLAHHGIYPEWVFAVRAEPWGAHCWVQQGDTVLNDGVEHINDCTPILVV